jgi:hypothetical protein
VIRHLLGSIFLACGLGYIAYLSPGHTGHDAGGGLACAFIVFALVFIGPRGFTDDA